MQSYSIFQSYSEQLAAVYTTRAGGVSRGNYASMNLCDYVGDDPICVAKNRSIFCNSLGIPSKNLILPKQNHGNKVQVIDSDFFKLPLEEQQIALTGVDGLVTNLKDICIGISTADCAAIVAYDKNNQVIGIAHAGWRGTLAQISMELFITMHRLYGSAPTDLLLAISPCISQANYEVGQELYDLFANHSFPVQQLFTYHSETNRWHFDLRGANRYSLIKYGIPESQIEIATDCTFEKSDTYFSARKLGIQSGRLTSCLMLK